MSVLASVVIAQLVFTQAPAPQPVPEQPAAQPQPQPAASPAPAAATAQPEARRTADQQPVSLATREPRREKSFNLLVGILELTVGTVAAYSGVLVGIVVNFPKGGLSWPPDVSDVLLLATLPIVLAAAGSWLLGLFDISQRTFFGSAMSALLGAAVGELVGLGAGYLIGRAAAPNDFALDATIAVLIAPAVSALGAVIFMELLKPGRVEAVSMSPSLMPVRENGRIAGMVPAVFVRW